MKKENAMAVASCSNNGFARHLATLFASILANWKNKEIHLQFYVVDDGIDDRNKYRLESTVKRHGVTLEFLSIDKSLFKNVVTSERIPASAYYRIIIPELICNKGIDKALYLDCDMIALKDITLLNELDLRGYTLAAVEDAGFHDRFKKMNIQPISDLYFNSGMMYINVKKWIEENSTVQILEFINKFPSLLQFHDQDALNAILHDRWLKLHPKWNAQRYMLANEKKHPHPQGEKEYKEARADPAIIHFTGRRKPWHSNYDLPLKKFYYYYANKTDFDHFSEHIYR